MMPNQIDLHRKIFLYNKLKVIPLKLLRQQLISSEEVLTQVVIKGKSSRKMLLEFKSLSRQFLGRHLWVRGYFVASSGNVTNEMIAEYIELQNVD